MQIILFTDLLSSELFSDGLIYASAHEKNNTFSSWCSVWRQIVRSYIEAT